MSEHGDLACLVDPVAQELLASAVPARLAYSWKDGTPRVVPIWFHTGVAEVAADRLAELVFVDAFYPGHGESALDQMPAPFQTLFTSAR